MIFYFQSFKFSTHNIYDFLYEIATFELLIFVKFQLLKVKIKFILETVNYDISSLKTRLN